MGTEGTVGTEETSKDIETVPICCICLDEKETKKNQIINYNHCYRVDVHNKCLTKWIQQTNECLVCRQKLEPDSDNENNYTVIQQFHHSIICYNCKECIKSILYCIVLLNCTYIFYYLLNLYFQYQ